MTAVGVALLGSPSRAAEPVALVEDVQGTIEGAEPMSFLAAGTELSVPPGATLILGYLRSCTHETIVGGHVVIGADQSLVEGGSLMRETVECDGGRLQLTVAQAKASGVMPVRTMPKPTQPRLTVYGTSPVLVLAAAGRLRIERVDVPAAPLDLAVDGLGAPAVLDLDRQGVALVPGGIYRVISGDRAGMFSIATQAKPGPIPLVSRILWLD